MTEDLISQPDSDSKHLEPEELGDTKTASAIDDQIATVAEVFVDN